MSRATIPGGPPPLTQAIQQHLFADPDATVYAVLDGAAIPDLLANLAQHRPEHVCLYRGRLEPDLATAAPYLIRLQYGSPFLEWLLQGWGQSYGIFALSRAGFLDMRRHFRTFLMIYDPSRKPLYFRYYDPRVLRTFLPACSPAERQTLFGPVLQYLVEGQDPKTILRFRPGSKSPETLRLLAVTPAAAPR